MIDELPPLPEPTLMMPEFVDGIGEHEEPMFDSTAMLAYGRACAKDAYERAAQLVIDMDKRACYEIFAEEYAREIRALG